MSPRWRRFVVGLLVVSALTLLAGGFDYQKVWFRNTSAAPSTINGGLPMPLKKSFNEFPTDFLGYNWQQGTLDEATERAVGCHAYLKLQGFRPGDTAWTEVYSSYTGFSVNLSEHEPNVCYGSQGWRLTFGEILKSKVDVPAWSGRPRPKLPLNVYFLQKDIANIMVVNYFCVNSRYETERTVIRTMKSKEHGFYSQTRVTMPLTVADMMTLDPKTFESHPKFQQAVQILQFVAPRLEDYLPMDGSQLTEAGQ